MGSSPVLTRLIVEPPKAVTGGSSAGTMSAPRITTAPNASENGTRLRYWLVRNSQR